MKKLSVVCIAAFSFVTLMSCKPKALVAETAATGSGDGSAKLASGHIVPASVKKFLDAFHANTKDVPYVWGGSSASAMDCSGSIVYSMRTTKGPKGQTFLPARYGYHGNMDSDTLNFMKCATTVNGIRPGDLLLLNKPGREPDHWVVVSDAVPGTPGSWKNLNKSNWWDSKKYTTEMMDQSTDFNGFHKESPVRSNIAARDIYACIRLKQFSIDYKALVAKGVLKAAVEEFDESANSIAAQATRDSSRLVVNNGFYLSYMVDTESWKASREKKSGCEFISGGGKCQIDSTQQTQFRVAYINRQRLVDALNVGEDSLPATVDATATIKTSDNKEFTVSNVVLDTEQGFADVKVPGFNQTGTFNLTLTVAGKPVALFQNFELVLN